MGTIIPQSANIRAQRALIGPGPAQAVYVRRALYEVTQRVERGISQIGVVDMHDRGVGNSKFHQSVRIVHCQCDRFLEQYRAAMVQRGFGDRHVH